MSPKKLEEYRREVLRFIEEERLLVEEMAQRPRQPNDPLDQPLLDTVRLRLEGIKKQAETEAEYDRLRDLKDDAENLGGHYRGYFCPAGDIEREGELIISIITKEWGLPKSVTDTLVKRGAELRKAPDEARAALVFLFAERDSWDDYTDDYEEEMWKYTRWLFIPAAALPIGAAFCFRYAFHPHFHWLLPLGVLVMGVAGSSVSIMRKVPEFEVRLSNELNAYRRRILSRMGLGIAASLIGSGLLAWGVLPISIQAKTFTGAVDDCCTKGVGCVELLLLMAVPMLLGFSERALTVIEEKLFGKAKRN